MPQWIPNQSGVTYTQAKLGSLSPWQWAHDRPDTDHFNRDYKPKEARGGTDICLLNPFSRTITPLTDNQENVWDFRTTCSADGEKIAFCRARVGETSELWIMDADGKNQKFLTRGVEDRGVDHPKFLL